MAREGEETPELPWERIDVTEVPDNPDYNYYEGEAATHKIDVKPQSLTTAATAITGKRDSLTATIKQISDTWNALKLGWVGETQTEADEFNNRWSAAYRAMFGDDKTPTSLGQISAGECALGKIQALANAASKTYANAEEGLTGRFYSFGEQLAGTYKADEWPDANKPETKNNHPEFKEDIPTLEGEIPAAENPSTERKLETGPINEVTPGK